MKENILFGSALVVAFMFALSFLIISSVVCKFYLDNRTFADAEKAHTKGIIEARQDAYNYIYAKISPESAKKYSNFVNAGNKITVVE